MESVASCQGTNSWVHSTTFPTRTDRQGFGVCCLLGLLGLVPLARGLQLGVLHLQIHFEKHGPLFAM